MTISVRNNVITTKNDTAKRNSNPVVPCFHTGAVLSPYWYCTVALSTDTTYSH